ncbi:MAG TPA: type II toxin-antitoxin system VapC family toxin [Thermodesulfobacteriota bacterium]|nr:type II toxin-antitoxin system VapC family toxin [Thermodesulfobacteriota bacterium]
MKRAVLDASVVLKWYLADEDHGQAALDLLQRYLSDNLEILAPSLLEYEVANGLLVAQRRGRLREEFITPALEGFLNLGIETVGISALYPRVLYFSMIYKCSAYDAAYLALSEAEKADFITADESLYNAVKRDLKWVKWVADG